MMSFSLSLSFLWLFYFYLYHPDCQWDRLLISVLDLFSQLASPFYTQYSFIRSFSKHVLSICQLPRTIEGAGQVPNQFKFLPQIPIAFNVNIKPLKLEIQNTCIYLFQLAFKFSLTTYHLLSTLGWANLTVSLPLQMSFQLLGILCCLCICANLIMVPGELTKVNSFVKSFHPLGPNITVPYSTNTCLFVVWVIG